MTTTFENARVGDRCFCLLGGKPDEKGQNALITNVGDTLIYVCYDEQLPRVSNSSNTWCFSKNGVWTGGAHINQMLFWSAPQIIAPPEPKRMRKVKKTGWVQRELIHGHKGFEDVKSQHCVQVTYEDEEEEG